MLLLHRAFESVKLNRQDAKELSKCIYFSFLASWRLCARQMSRAKPQSRKGSTAISAKREFSKFPVKSLQLDAFFESNQNRRTGSLSLLGVLVV